MAGISTTELATVTWEKYPFAMEHKDDTNT
jgi:hypothetical protein